MKLLQSVVLASAAASVASAIALPKRNWDYQNDKVQGVNLGGWFVLEPYITPSLFTAFDNGGIAGGNIPVDEYHYTSQLGKTEAFKRLNNHWLSWYTEADFKDMADAGINTVRIPIGYWAFKTLDNDPYVQGQQKYLDLALGWARTHSIQVWIDLHGAPGSQNGFDNSGLRDQVDFQDDDNVSLTLTALQMIFDKYGGEDYQDVVSGIEILNEPLGPLLDMNSLKQFYQWAYHNMRSVSTNTVIIHDAFQAFNYWDDEMTVSQGYWDIVLDHHHYQVFSAGELERLIDEHIATACSWGTGAQGESHWTVAGEWSAALTDCALWLNGVGRGARWSGNYDNSPYIGLCDAYTEASNWTDEYRANVRKYIEAQLDAFELTGGWIFWNWKTESAIDWDMLQLISEGVFPQPFSDRQYPNQCGF